MSPRGDAGEEPRPDGRSVAARGTARTKLLEAATQLIRLQGLSGTSVDAICAQAGVTKGAFFHHFGSKEALAVAAAEHWSQTTGAMFAEAGYHEAGTPAERVLAYLDLRDALVGPGGAEEWACLAGTMVQEAFATQPEVRLAAGASILGHAETLEDDLRAALAEAGEDDVDPAGLARHVQAVLQGAFILGKAGDDPQLVHDSIAHLRRYLTTLLLAPAVPAA